MTNLVDAFGPNPSEDALAANKRAADSSMEDMQNSVALNNFRTAAQALELIRAAVEETFGYHHGTDVEPDIMAEAHKVVEAIWAGYNRSTDKDVEIAKLNRLLEERTALLDKKTKTIQRMCIARKRTKIS